MLVESWGRVAYCLGMMNVEAGEGSGIFVFSSPSFLTGVVELGRF